MYLKYNKLFDVLEATHIQRRIAPFKQLYWKY